MRSATFEINGASWRFFEERKLKWFFVYWCLFVVVVVVVVVVVLTRSRNAAMNGTSGTEAGGRLSIMKQ